MIVKRVTLFQLTANLSLPSHWSQVLREVLATVRDILPTDELKQFVDAVGAYAEKVGVVQPAGSRA